MFSALTLVTNLMNGNKLDVEAKGVTESNKERLSEALTTFISVGNAGAVVTMEGLSRFKEVRQTSTKRYTSTRKSFKGRK